MQYGLKEVIKLLGPTYNILKVYHTHDMAKARWKIDQSIALSEIDLNILRAAKTYTDLNYILEYRTKSLEISTIYWNEISKSLNILQSNAPGNYEYIDIIHFFRKHGISCRIKSKV